MKNLTTKAFCWRFRACEEGAKFAAQFKHMRECYDALLRGEAGEDSPTWAIWVATRKRVMPERDLRLFAVKCARRVQHFLPDDRLIRVLAIADLYAIGDATAEELAAARKAADDIVWEQSAWLVTASAVWRAYVAVDAAAMKTANVAAWVAADAAAMNATECESQLRILAQFGNPFEEEVEK